MLEGLFSLDSTFRAKLSVMFKGRLLHSTVHSDDHVTDCNHRTIQRGGEYDDDPFQTGHNNRHRPYRTRVLGWLLPPIAMTGVRLGGEHEMRGDERQSEIVLMGDLGRVVSQLGLMGTSANAGSGMVLVRRSGVGWGGCCARCQGMFFAVQGDSARHLTLLTVTDGDLHVRFELNAPRVVDGGPGC